MIRLGEIQTLEIIKKLVFGVYLSDEERSEEILLPKKQVPDGVEIGDRIEVFVYKDSKDRPIATTKEPLVTYGKTAVLEVKDVTKIGAFLDWGLEKDLMLPFSEQIYKPTKGDKVLIAVYTDKSKRLCATMKVYDYLKTRSPYVIGDEVKARVYELNPKYGAFLAVDDKYSALIQNKDMQGRIVPGEVLDVRVTHVREDGRLTVTPRKKAYLQLAPDSELILAKLMKNNGILPYDDHADPDFLKAEFGISKAALKRAVGHLMKDGKIELKDGKILAK